MQTHGPANMGLCYAILIPCLDAGTLLCTDISSMKRQERPKHMENTSPISHTLDNVRLHRQSSPFSHNLLSGVSEY